MSLDPSVAGLTPRVLDALKARKALDERGFLRRSKAAEQQSGLSGRNKDIGKGRR